MTALAALAGGGFAASVCLLISAIWPAPTRARQPGRITKLAVDLRATAPQRVWVAGGLGLTVALITRWPVAVIAATTAGWFIPLPGQRARRTSAEGRTEAIALWTEMLRDAAGTARGIEGMLTATAPSAPVAIRTEVLRMARRLEYEPIDVALDGLAHDLAHPIGDLVVTALRLAATAGAKRVRLVLDDLATAAHQEASMHRRVDVARQRPRTTMQLVAVIVGVFIGGLLVFSRSYLHPYSTPLGQLVLAVVAVYWALGLMWMSRMGRLAEQDRFLARSVARR